MGLLSWWKGKALNGHSPATNNGGDGVAAKPSEAAVETSGLNGAMEVRRPADVTVFEFGSAVAAGEKVTLAGYCPVSDELEPCRWEIIPAAGSNAPQFRIVF
ncbi:uncharacterized protein LOC110019810 [Phalaenopsis equestris]|uniref:uncharacterized protein LOC110019810 n=1 Tax=Phalaenopsis equestris TaxID=78828 RepID=UPI0009E3AA50|nr:uncharacterized protein LOC110019810 [Phalaenopsis equestris]